MKTSPNFKKTIYRLAIAGIFVVVCFQLGSWVYMKTVAKFPSKTKLPSQTLTLENLPKKSIALNAGSKTITLKVSEIKDFTENYVRDYTGEKGLRLSESKIEDYLGSIAPNIDNDPIDAKFQFKDSVAQIFTPAVPGEKLNITKSAAAIANAIIKNQPSANLVIDSVEPEITLEKINSLGINTLIGSGESNFAGSSPARVQNIKIGAAKFNGLILKPGEELSFNTILGPVDEKAGYAAEKVIKNNKMVYDYGGGLCQVSTTLFRAAIYAGLPITERRPHAFPVQYYNPQGFDATIYPGVTDLKFVNNTPNHVLFQSRIVGTKLIFEVYGSSDGRKITIEGPVQYDKQPDGSMRAYFTRTITHADGTPKTERFDSNYRSPALYPLEKNPLE